MTDADFPNLVKLSEANITLSDPSHDLRDDEVFDNNGEEIGKVKDLLIDEKNHQVRMLLVGEGGFLGIGEDRVMIPTDAITRVENKQVHVDLERNVVAKGPTFDPKQSGHEPYWIGAYGHYGFLPFWAPGYRSGLWPRV